MTALGAGLRRLQDVEATPHVAALVAEIERLGSVIVAFSGGADSALLAKVAHDVLGERALAATAVSASLAADERRDARALAELIGLEHVEVETLEGADPDYAANTPRRCFHCKEHLFVALEGLRRTRGFARLAYGAVPEDLGDDRPGMEAARLAHAAAPLLDAAMPKAEVRELSARLGLPTWDKPAMACLASRIPHGTPVTSARLAAVEAAERHVKSLGFAQVRVRHLGELARVEVAVEELPRAVAAESELARGVLAAGFVRVEIDPRGYRQGGAQQSPSTVFVIPDLGDLSS